MIQFIDHQSYTDCLGKKECQGIQYQEIRELLGETQHLTGDGRKQRIKTRQIARRLIFQAEGKEM